MWFHVVDEHEERVGRVLVEPLRYRGVDHSRVLIVMIEVDPIAKEPLTRQAQTFVDGQTRGRVRRPKVKLGSEVSVLVKALLKVEHWGDIDVAHEPRCPVAP